MAAIGVRNSCAASAVKRRSDSISAPMRSNRPFSASTIGCISRGAPSTATGCSACGSRAASARPSRRNGAMPRRTAHHTASASSGSATAIGCSVLRSTARRIDARERICSPT